VAFRQMPAWPLALVSWDLFKLWRFHSNQVCTPGQAVLLPGRLCCCRRAGCAAAAGQAVLLPPGRLCCCCWFRAEHKSAQ
jgi:hypothetical protein